MRDWDQTLSNQNEGTSSGDGRRQAKNRILGRRGREERDDRPNLALNFKRLVPAARRRKGEGEERRRKEKKERNAPICRLGDRIC